jgi:hypothetical protein
MEMHFQSIFEKSSPGKPVYSARNPAMLAQAARRMASINPFPAIYRPSIVFFSSNES